MKHSPMSSSPRSRRSAASAPHTRSAPGWPFGGSRPPGPALPRGRGQLWQCGVSPNQQRAQCASPQWRRFQDEGLASISTTVRCRSFNLRLCPLWPGANAAGARRAYREDALGSSRGDTGSDARSTRSLPSSSALLSITAATARWGKGSLLKRYSWRFHPSRRPPITSTRRQELPPQRPRLYRRSGRPRTGYSEGLPTPLLESAEKADVRQGVCSG
jgi:hypothetical protein